MTVRLITADDVCVAAATVLANQLPGVVTAFGLDDPATPEGPYPAVTTWAQIPTLDALETARFPAGAVSSPGLVEPPVRRSTGTDATWRLEVGLFDRGSDFNITSTRTRTWAQLITAVLLRNPTLGGVVESTRWVGQSYRRYPKPGAARTIGGCVSEFNVTVRNVVDVADIAYPTDTPGAPTWPTGVVESTHPILTIR